MIVLGLLKLLLLVFGVIVSLEQVPTPGIHRSYAPSAASQMSFTTRGVSENFNESKSIAFSVYNQLFTVRTDLRLFFGVVGFAAAG